MPADTKQADLDRMFIALAEPRRRQILEQLAQKSDSVEALSVPLATTTWNTLKHVRVLEDAGLVLTTKVGRKRMCQLEPEALSQVTTWIVDLRTFWASNLKRLQHHLTDNG